MFSITTAIASNWAVVELPKTWPCARAAFRKVAASWIAVAARRSAPYASSVHGFDAGAVVAPSGGNASNSRSRATSSPSRRSRVATACATLPPNDQPAR